MESSLTVSNCWSSTKMALGVARDLGDDGFGLADGDIARAVSESRHAGNAAEIAGREIDFIHRMVGEISDIKEVAIHGDVAAKDQAAAVKYSYQGAIGHVETP